MSIRKCARHLSSTVTHTPVTNQEITYRDIAIPTALVHGTLQVLNSDMVTPVLHYLSLWPTGLSRRDIADRDSNVWEFLTSGNSDATNSDSSGSVDTCSTQWTVLILSVNRGSRFCMTRFLCARKLRFSDPQLPGSPDTYPPR
jgi:hypothetical protein